MNKRKLAAFAAAACWAVAPASWATQITYNVIDVGYVQGVALNESGQITGEGYSDPNVGGPFLTGPNGKGFHVLGPFPAGNTVLVNGINNAGQVAGVFYGYGPSDVLHAFVTGPHGAGRTDLGVERYPHDVNNGGAVCGFAFERPRGGFVVDENGQLHVYRNLPALAPAALFAINDSGQVAGFTQISPDHSAHALFGEPNGGRLKDLGQGQAQDINNLGEVVGNNALGAFITGPNGGALTTIGAFTVDAVNDAGVVVGYTGAATTVITDAVIYTSLNGIQDLDDLIDPRLGFHLDAAQDINDRGQILALGRINGYLHTFLLTPASVPDAGSNAVLFGCALAGLLLFAAVTCRSSS